MRSIFFLLVLAVAIAAALTFLPRFNYETAFVLPTAETPGGDYVSVGAPGEEVPLACPVGIEFVGPSILALLDADELRLLEIDVDARRLLSAAPVALPAGAGARAFVYGDGALWVWAQNAATDFSAPVLFARADRGFAEAPVFGARITPTGETLRKFEELGFARAEELSLQAFMAERSEWSTAPAAPGGRSFPVGVAIDGRKTRVTIDSGGPTTAAYDVETLRQVASARVLKATDGAEVFLSVASWDPSSSTIAVRKSVYRLDPGAAAPAVYDAPLQEGDCTPKQNVAISDSGEIYALRVREESVAILRLKPRTRVNEIMQWIDWRFGPIFPQLSFKEFVDSLGVSPAHAQAEAVRDQRASIARAAIIENACAYLGHAWTPASDNLDVANWKSANADYPLDKDICADAESACFKSDDEGCWKWRAPDFVAQRTRGLPYSWGGADRLDDFDRKIGAMRPAGDECTRATGASVARKKYGASGGIDMPSDVTGKFAAGVDCAGFVQRAWGHPGRSHPYSTSSLEGVWNKDKERWDLRPIAEPIALSEMRPGDVLNKKGSHVRMLMDWAAAHEGVILPDRMRMIESTTDGECNGLCVKEAGYTFEEMNGYKALRTIYVDDTGPPLAADMLCR